MPIYDRDVFEESISCQDLNTFIVRYKFFIKASRTKVADKNHWVDD